MLETGTITVPVDAELFNVGFQASIDVLPDGDFWVHERCMKWSLAEGEDSHDYDLTRAIVVKAAKQVGTQRKTGSDLT